MSADPDRLWELLPVIYRQRDLELGKPLQSLLRVIAEQVDVVETSIDQLYDNWFIETCESWVVPYVADLIGYRPVAEAFSIDAASRFGNCGLISRQEVANTIRYRRRKGTILVLQLLAIDVAGWPARVVEFDRLISVNQSINHLGIRRPATVDLRKIQRPDQLDTPFDASAHTVDVRRPGSHRRSGRYNLPSVVVFVSRMRIFSITESDANCIEERGRNCFTFSALGNDTPIYARPDLEANYANVSGQLDLPLPISRRVLGERHTENGVEIRRIDDYYGPDKSFAIWVTGWGQHSAASLIPPNQILVVDLSHWRYRPRPNTVAVDPELGRMVFPHGHAPKQVSVTYHYGFSAELGGGEYQRRSAPGSAAKIYPVSKQGEESHGSLAAALASWQADAPPLAVVEFGDSAIYDEEDIELHLHADQQLVIRAAAGTRPLLRLLEWNAGRGDALRIRGERGSRLIVEGLLISGRGLNVTGDLAELAIHHSTLVPGWDLFRDGKPRHPGGPSLALEETMARIVIRHSIVGPVSISQDVEALEPVAIEVADSIIDAGSDDGEAFQVQGALAAYARVALRRTTVLGRLSVHEIALAENSIISGQCVVARRQRGCVRFCYVAPGSRTPSRYSCQPELAIRGLSGEARRAAELRLVPAFASTRYGAAQYARLSMSCAAEIRCGADDEAELGVYHDLFEPRREAALRARLAEFVPTDCDVGISFLD